MSTCILRGTNAAPCQRTMLCSKSWAWFNFFFFVSNDLFCWSPSFWHPRCTDSLASVNWMRRLLFECRANVSLKTTWTLTRRFTGGHVWSGFLPRAVHQATTRDSGEGVVGQVVKASLRNKMALPYKHILTYQSCRYSLWSHPVSLWHIQRHLCGAQLHGSHQMALRRGGKRTKAGIISSFNSVIR